jgi:phosphotransferase system HPr-like phosphotransfer protein
MADVVRLPYRQGLLRRALEALARGDEIRIEVKGFRARVLRRRVQLLKEYAAAHLENRKIRYPAWRFHLGFWVLVLLLSRLMNVFFLAIGRGKTLELESADGEDAIEVVFK